MTFKDFGYNDVTLKWRMFNLRTWKDLLKADLNNGYPICYSSGDVLALEGHTYVCDGYNDDNKFSFNWGWNGDCNGYFYPLDSLENMNDFHSAIFNIVPDDNDYYCDFTSNLYNYYLNHTDKIPYEITPRTFTRLRALPKQRMQRAIIGQFLKMPELNILHTRQSWEARHTRG
jgi:Peptidase C10 family.